MLTITVEKRGDDYMAYLNGDRRLWSSGRSESEAIGAALVTHAVLRRPGSDERSASTPDLSSVQIVYGR